MVRCRLNLMRQGRQSSGRDKENIDETERSKGQVTEHLSLVD